MKKLEPSQAMIAMIFVNIILFTIIIYLSACTIGVSHRVIINEYGDTDTTKTNKKFVNIINYKTDSIKPKHK